MAPGRSRGFFCDERTVFLGQESTPALRGRSASGRLPPVLHAHRPMGAGRCSAPMQPRFVVATSCPRRNHDKGLPGWEDVSVVSPGQAGAVVSSLAAGTQRYSAEVRWRRAINSAAPAARSSRAPPIPRPRPETPVAARLGVFGCGAPGVFGCRGSVGGICSST